MRKSKFTDSQIMDAVAQSHPIPKKLGNYSINQSKNLAAPPDGQFSVGGNKYDT
jgi:hypothetical protein